MPTGGKRDADLRRAPKLRSIARRCTEAIVLAHGFAPEMMVEMICDGLATASAKRVVAGSVRSVGDQAAAQSKLSSAVDRRYAVPGHQSHDEFAMQFAKGLWCHNEASTGTLPQGGNHGFYVARIVHV